MKLLQRYVVTDLLRVFLSLLSVMTVLLVFVGVFGEASESGLGLHQMLKIVPYVVPSLLPFTIPATLLLTICVVYGRMAGDLEITAAKAAGINVFTLLKPAFVLGVVLSVCSWFLADQVIPWADANIKRTVTLAVEDIFFDMLETNHQVSNDAHGVAITVVGVEGRKLLMPTFQYARQGHSPVKLQAQEATLEFDLDNKQVVLHLVRGHIETPDNRRLFFARDSRRFPMPDSIRNPKPRHMSIREIHTRMDELTMELEDNRTRRDLHMAMGLTQGNFDLLEHHMFERFNARLRYDGAEYAKLETEVHSRVALSTSCFFFVLVGAPVSILQARRQFLTTFMFCFIPILLVYYPLVLGMMNMSKTGTIGPEYAMWFGNGLLLVAGAYYLRKVLKH